MTSINASAAGQFRIGDITINRLGYRAMRITVPASGDRLLIGMRRSPRCADSPRSVNFIDTADSYGPYVSEKKSPNWTRRRKAFVNRGKDTARMGRTPVTLLCENR